MKEIKLDPRSKIVVFIITSIYAYGVTSFFPSLGMVFFVAVLLCLLGKVSMGIKLFAFYTVMLIVWYFLIRIENNPLATAVSIVVVMIRMFLPIIMAFVMLFLTTKISEFMAAFEKMHLPNLVMVPFVVMLRFIPTVKEEWSGISNAMAFRGIKFSLGSILCHPLRTAEYILVPLLFSCVHIMDELVAASLVRGLESSKKRVCYFHIKMGIWDYLVLLISFGFLAFMFFI
ncbi:MAG: energy-coupling factor transporter transmembrane component T [Eubacteriales bacterium]